MEARLNELEAQLHTMDTQVLAAVVSQPDVASEGWLNVDPSTGSSWAHTLQNPGHCDNSGALYQVDAVYLYKVYLYVQDDRSDSVLM